MRTITDMRRNTRQKEAILTVLKNTRAHPTADLIYELVKKKIPHISKGTVYRNLQVLQEMGQITELNLGDEINRYEIKQKPHCHFRCEQCGCVIDLDVTADKEIDKKVSEKTGLIINSHQMEFQGICNNCQKH
jgi:Fur family transcriptional regulator, peroxide stress response regulator